MCFVVAMGNAQYVFSETSSLRLLCGISPRVVPACPPAAIILGDVFYVWRRLATIAQRVAPDEDTPHAPLSALLHVCLFLASSFFILLLRLPLPLLALFLSFASVCQ